VLGAAAAAENRSRAVLSGGAKAAWLATRPAARVWRSPLAAPLRTRADELTAALDRDGREFAAQAGIRARSASDRLLAAGIADDIVDRLLDSGALDRVITVALNNPATSELVANVLDDPATDRIVAQVMDSRLVDAVTARLLESDELQQILDYVTRSPELRAALAHQTAGLAGDVAGRVRSRTETADDRVERLARSLVRRGNRSKHE
jgi:hypothetical protein